VRCWIDVTYNQSQVMNALLRKYRRTVHEEPLTPEEVEAANVAALPLWLFAFVWSVGASVGADGRKRLEEFTRAKAEAHGFSQHLPPKDESGQLSMYDYAYDQDELAWKDWLSTVPKAKVDPDMAFSNIIVPTSDTISYSFVIDRLVLLGEHVLCVGETPDPNPNPRPPRAVDRVLASLPRLHQLHLIRLVAVGRTLSCRGGSPISSPIREGA